MEQQDLELERRVWQRVSGNVGTTAQPSLREMEQRSRESALAFRQLAQQCPISMRETLQELARMEHGNAAALLGMRVLSGEEPEKTPCCPWTKTGTCRALALAYRRSCQAREDYAACAKAGGSYGPVFSWMAEAETEKMGRILSLIGMSKGY